MHVDIEPKRFSKFNPNFLYFFTMLSKSQSQGNKLKKPKTIGKILVSTLFCFMDVHAWPDYMLFILRIVQWPTTVIAHTFCASRDTGVSYWWCLLIQEYFAWFKTIQRKQNLVSALIQKENWRFNHAFFRDVKRKERNFINCLVAVALGR